MSQINVKVTPQESYEDLLKEVNPINDSDYLCEILKCFVSQISSWGYLRKDILGMRDIKGVNSQEIKTFSLGFPRKLTKWSKDEENTKNPYIVIHRIQIEENYFGTTGLTISQPFLRSYHLSGLLAVQKKYPKDEYMWYLSKVHPHPVSHAYKITGFYNCLTI